jgi:hypothetical protein
MFFNANKTLSALFVNLSINLFFWIGHIGTSHIPYTNVFTLFQIDS